MPRAPAYDLAHRPRRGGQHHLGRGDSRQGGQGLLGGFPHRGVDRRVARVDLQHEAGLAVGHDQALHQAGAAEALPRLRIAYGVERLQRRLMSGINHGLKSALFLL